MKLTAKEIKEVEQTMERYEISGVSELDYIVANSSMFFNECEKTKEKLRQATEIIDNPDGLLFQQSQLIESLQQQLAEKVRALKKVEQLRELLYANGISCANCIYFGRWGKSECIRTEPAGFVLEPTDEVCEHWRDEPEEEFLAVLC